MRPLEKPPTPLPEAAAEEAGLRGACLRRLDRLLREFIPREIPGAVAAVARRGRLVFYEAYGYAALYPERRPMERDTLFDLASLTKVMVATPLLLGLAEEGILRLDDPVAEFYPDFGANGKDAVTFRHILCHTAGLHWWRDFYRSCRGRDEIIAAICQEKLDAAPGTRVVYSDLGFMLLTEIVERITGMDLARAARERVFSPLGMTDAMYRPAPEAAARAAATEYQRESGIYLCGEVHDENARGMGGISGHAGLFGTAADVLRYGQAWLDGGRGSSGDKILSPATIAAATRDQTAGLGDRRGLGWALRSPAGSPAGDFFSGSAFGHTGFTGTSLWIDPGLDLVAVLLTNRVHPTRENPAIIKLRPRFHNILAAAAIESGASPGAP